MGGLCLGLGHLSSHYHIMLRSSCKAMVPGEFNVSTVTTVSM